MRFVNSLSIAAILAFSMAPAFSHEEFRLVGTVTKFDKASLQLKPDSGKVVNVKLNGQTKFTKDKQKVPSSALKMGDTVIVDALGDSFADLSAEEVRIAGKP